MSYTVVPIHKLSLPAGTRIRFGNDLVLQDVPDWVKNDTAILNDINLKDRRATLDAKHAWVAEYEASCIDEPDPSWKGMSPKSIQQLKFESVILANLALWLRQPSPIAFTVGFHALDRHISDQLGSVPIIQNVQCHTRLFCHPKDVHNQVSQEHVIKAATLHVALLSIPRNNSLWEALRACWAALTTSDADRRYPFFWMALESLFGGDKSYKHLTRKIARRIALFLGDNNADAQSLLSMVFRCYRMRCKIFMEAGTMIRRLTASWLKRSPLSGRLSAISSMIQNSSIASSPNSAIHT